MRIDLSAIAQGQENDEVVLIGPQGGEEITLAEVRTVQHATQSDIAMSIGPMVSRVRLGMATNG